MKTANVNPGNLPLYATILAFAFCCSCGPKVAPNYWHDFSLEQNPATQPSMGKSKALMRISVPCSMDKLRLVAGNERWIVVNHWMYAAFPSQIEFDYMMTKSVCDGPLGNEVMYTAALKNGKVVAFSIREFRINSNSSRLLPSGLWIVK